MTRESLKMAICRAKNPPRNEKSRQVNPHSLPIHTIHPVDFSFLTGFYAIGMRVLRLLRSAEDYDGHWVYRQGA
jgi:hypothetical protein